MSNAPNEGLCRRAFGQLLGVAALTGAMPDVSLGAPLQSPPPPNATTDDRVGAGDELCDLAAVDLAARIRRKQVSAREVMAPHLARIERVNPKINAIVTLVADRAMADAKKADELQARGGALGPPHGLPVAHKDLAPSTPRARSRSVPPFTVPYVAGDSRRAVRRSHRRFDRRRASSDP